MTNTQTKDTKQTALNHLIAIQANFDSLVNFLWENRQADSTKDLILNYLDESFPDITHEINKAKQAVEKL